MTAPRTKIVLPKVEPFFPPELADSGRRVDKVLSQLAHDASVINADGAAGLAAHLADHANPHVVTKAQVGLSLVENTALSTWAGSANIATVGTITSGIWHGTPIAAAYLGAHTHPWSDITSTPTTLLGYGITDAYTKVASDARFAPISHTHAASDVTSGTFADARIAQSNVTQHQAALAIAYTQLTYSGLTAGQVLRATAAGAAAFGALDLANASAVTGLLPWANVSKTGSSLADLTTRSAGDLSSGNLAYARLPTGGGTWANSGELTITGSGVNANDTGSTNSLVLGSADGTSTLLYIRSAAARSGVRFVRANNTIASPTDVADGDQIGLFESRAYSNGYKSVAAFDFVVDGTFTTGQRPPTSMRFFTTTAGSGQLVRAVISTGGVLVLSTTSAIGNATQGGIRTTGTSDFGGDLLFTDAADDIGKSGATRPRDLWLSRSLSVAAGGSAMFGHTALLTTQPAVTPNTQVVGTDGLTSAGMAFVNFQASALGPRFAFAHSRGGSIGTHTRLNTNDQLGGLDFSASDGTVFQQAAYIRTFAGATQSATSLPSYVEIGTTADTTTTTRSIVRFTAAGDLALRAASKLILSGLAGTTSYIYEVVSNVVSVNVSGNDMLLVRGTNVQLAGDLLFNDATYDIGDATHRPRDLTLSRNFTAGGLTNIGGSLTVVGATTLATSMTGILRADAGVVSVAVGVGTKSLFDHFADANNGTTVETDLYSDTIAASQLGGNGQKLSAQYGGTFVGDGTSTQRVRAYFGGTLIFDTGALGVGVTTSSWDMWVTVVRESSTVVRVSVSFTSQLSTFSADATYTKITGLTLTNTQVLKVTGTAAGITGGSNQITASEGFVQWVPAA